MINLSYYPFLKESLEGQHISEFQDHTINYAKDNIEQYNPTNLLDIDREVFLISTIILRNLNNNFLIRKFVDNYGKLFEGHFRTDINHHSLKHAVFEYFNIRNIQFDDKKRQIIKGRMNDILELSVQVDDKYPKFKLINLNPIQGYIYCSLHDFIFLCRLVLEKKLFEKIKKMKAYHGDKRINEVVDGLRVKYPEYKPKKNNTTKVPQSIQELINIAYTEHHLTHPQRIKLGIYLQANNFDEDYIIEIFKQLSDYDEKTTKYQLKSLLRYIK